MSALINPPVLCTSISLPKRSKSGKKGAEIGEWNSETNGSLVLVPFGVREKMVPVGESLRVPQHFQGSQISRYGLIPMEEAWVILSSSFEQSFLT